MSDIVRLPNETAPRAPRSASATERLSFLEKFGFGVGDLASNLLFQTFNMFLLFFYTDVVGLSASAIFWIFLVAKIWDMINDPLMGAVADRTRTRWGRYRPYIFIMAIPYGISAYLLFTVPDLSDTAKIFYCGATYILATMIYTAINIPYCALMGVVTPNVRERTSVSQYRFFLAFAGGWLINTFTLPLVKLFGNDASSPTYRADVGYDPVQGYPTAMIVFGGLAVALFFMTFLTTKERVAPSAQAQTAFSLDLKDLAKNLPWLILFAAAVLNLANVAVRNGSMVYYLTYFMGEGSKTVFTLGSIEISRTAVFMSLGAFATMLGVLPTQALCRRFEKKSLLIFFMISQGLVYGLIYFAPAGNYGLLLALHALGSLLAGPGPVLVFSMYADVADFSEWKTGRRATGLIIATILFGIKMGLWLGSQLSAAYLGYIGYDKDTVASRPEVQNGIALLFTWTPGILAIASGLLIFLYPISDNLLRSIERDLIARKSGLAGRESGATA